MLRRVVQWIRTYGLWKKIKHKHYITLCVLLTVTWVGALLKLQHLECEEDRPAVIVGLARPKFYTPEIMTDPPGDMNAPYYCDINCTVGRPCVYRDQVDLRVIVITYNRHESVRKCLDSVITLDTLGDLISVEIWVDRSPDGEIDNKVVDTAELFVHQWMKVEQKGRACIHKQANNAYIGGQWVDTWRPQEGSTELALILEDDISISPFAYKWIKAAHARFGKRDDIAGYTLQMENTYFFANEISTERLQASSDQTAFLYPVLGTWGFAPHPKSWRQFQDWYHTLRPHRSTDTDHIVPLIPGIVPTEWYKVFRASGTQEAMWEMWHLKYSHDVRHYTVYSNMRMYSGAQSHPDIYLSTNRLEKGLHFKAGMSVDNTRHLLRQWEPAYVRFPEDKDLMMFNYNGANCTETCCFSTTCLSVIKRFISKSWKEKLWLMTSFWY